MKRRDTRDIQALVAREDFGVVAQRARDAARRSDAQAQARIIDALWGWLFARWQTTPLPRVAELLSVLGPRRPGPGAARLEAQTARFIDDTLWDEVLRGASLERDLDALLEALPRARITDMIWRFERLRDVFTPARRDPRLTSRFLRWLEAPPVRALSSRPMWSALFDVLFAQADPRALGAFERLVDADFPAGATMQRWMHGQLTAQLARWQARPDAAALRAALRPAAEGPLAQRLDEVAAAVTALTDAEFIAGGGETQGRRVDALLRERTPPQSVWRAGAALVTRGLAVESAGWQVHGRSDDARRCLVYRRETNTLAVCDADGTLRWVRACAAAPGGAALSSDGRRLAFLDHDAALTLVDLERGGARAAPVLDPALPRVALSSRLSSRSEPLMGVTFARRGHRVYSAHLLVHDAPASPSAPALLIARATFDPDTLRVMRRELVCALLQRSPSPRASGPPLQLRTSAPLALAVSDDERWIAVHGILGSSPQRATAFIELIDGAPRIHQAFNGWLLDPLQWGEDGRLRALDRQLVTRSNPVIREVAIDPRLATLEVVGEAQVHASLPLEHVDAVAACAAPGVALTAAYRDGEGVVERWLDGARAGELLRVKHKRIGAVALAGDGRWALLGTSRTFERHPLVYSGRRPRPIRFSGHKDTPTQLLTDRASERVISVAPDAVMLWSADGERLHDLRHQGAPRRAALHPDGEALATADDRQLHVWDTRDGALLCAAPLPDGGLLTDLAWSLDQRALWCVLDGALRGWRPDAPRTGLLWRPARPLIALVTDPTAGTAIAEDLDGALWLIRLDDGARDGDSGGGVDPAPLLDAPARLTALTPPAATPGRSPRLALGASGTLVLHHARRGVISSALTMTPVAHAADDAAHAADDAAHAADDAAHAADAPTPDAAHDPDAPPLPVACTGEVAPAPDAALRQAREAALRGLRADPWPAEARAALRARLEHGGRRASAIRDLIHEASVDAWTSLLAEFELTAAYSAARPDPLFGLTRAEALPHLVTLLQGAPEAVTLARVYLDHIEQLTLDEGGPPPDALRIPGLRELTLPPCGVDFSDLTGLPALERLVIQGACRVEADAALDALGQRLRDLRAPASLRALSWLVRGTAWLPELRGSVFKDVTLLSAIATALTGFDEVTALTLRSGMNLSSLRGLAGNRALRRLELSLLTRLDSLEGLEATPLRDLTVNNAPRLGALAPLEGVALETLSLGGCGVRSLRGLEASSGLRSLRVRCNVRGASPRGQPVDALRSLEGLRSVALESVELINGLMDSVEALAPSAPTLTTLSLCGGEAIVDLSPLAEARRLRVVDLRGCCSLRVLPPLEACDDLELLALHNTPITPADLPPRVRARATWAREPFEPLMRSPLRLAHLP